MAIKVTYRRTSRLSMRIVKNGDVHVSVPIGMSREKVMAFIDDHRDWIETARKKTIERHQQRAAFYSKLPLTTRTQVDEALRKLKEMVPIPNSATLRNDMMFISMPVRPMNSAPRQSRNILREKNAKNRESM